MGRAVRDGNSGNEGTELRVEPTGIEGVLIMEGVVSHDERGTFRRLFDARVLSNGGLDFDPVHVNVSTNDFAHTLRGMHYQRKPLRDRKVVSCLRGSAFDVVVDLRPDSSTYLQWHGVTLSDSNGLAIHIPEDCAHGFLTLEDSTSLHYVINVPYVPNLGAGIRWDDPAIGVIWPAAPVVISHRDESLPTVEQLDGHS